MANIVIGLNGEVSFCTNVRTSWAATANTVTGFYVGAATANTLVPITVVRNATLNLNAAEGDGSQRGSKYKLYIQTLKDASIDLEIPWAPTDPSSAFNALLAAYLKGSNIGLACLDGTSVTSGSQGLFADFTVTDFTREEPIEKEMMAKVKLKPSPSNVPPQWVVVN